MQFIEKNNPIAIEIIANFLESHWDAASSKYNNAAKYDDNTFPKQRLSAALAEEQNYCCCYCMRRIDGERITLEHFIPKGSKTTEAIFDKYIAADASNVLRDNVVFKPNFDKSTHISAAPLPHKYPHDVAYHNLWAACDTNKTCNNGRGDTYIKPFLYDAQAVGFIAYAKDGFVVSEEDDELNANVLAKALNLNSEFLKLVRKIWFRLSRNENFRNATDISKDAVEESVYDNFTDLENVDNLNDFFPIDDNAKNTILDYPYFFDYYRQHYPLCPSTT